MKLTDAKLRTLTEPGKHSDGAGLYLELTQAGGRYWRMKYRHGGKEKRLAFGVYPAVSLKAARDLATAARKVLASGADPGDIREAEKAQAAHEAVNTLEAVAGEWLAHQSSRWAPVTLGRIRASLAADVFPALGSRPLASIKPGDVMAVIKKIEGRGAGDMAGRVLQRVKSVYRWAVIHERISDNPMLDLVQSEILKPRTVQHRVPLSTQAVALLRTVHALSGGRELVFPSPVYPSKPISENIFNSALARMGYEDVATAHGFRSLFFTVANECGWNGDVIERQLAHKEANAVRAAYHRSTYLDERAKLMQWWADYMNGRKASNVIQMPRRAA